MRLEALFRLLGGDDFEELLLPRGLRTAASSSLSAGEALAWLMATVSRRRARRA